MIQKVIVSAFAWLRLCYDKDDDDIDKLFHYFLSCIVFKRIVLPESNLIYQIYKGITPGHGMTNIINTVCINGTSVIHIISV